MNASFFDITMWLGAQGVGTIGVDLFGGSWGEVDRQILIMEGVGVPSELKDVYEEIGVQVLARGAKNENPNDVYKRIKAVSDFLLNAPELVEVNGCEYSGFEPTSNIAPLGLDSNQRHIFSANFSSYRKGAV